MLNTSQENISHCQPYLISTTSLVWSNPPSFLACLGNLHIFPTTLFAFLLTDSSRSDGLKLWTKLLLLPLEAKSNFFIFFSEMLHDSPYLLPGPSLLPPPPAHTASALCPSWGSLNTPNPLLPQDLRTCSSFYSGHCSAVASSERPPLTTLFEIATHLLLFLPLSYFLKITYY